MLSDGVLMLRWTEMDKSPGVNAHLEKYLLRNSVCAHFSFRYGSMLEPKSFSLMPSAWAVSRLWEVTMPTTTTATGKKKKNGYHRMDGWFGIK